MPVSAPVSLLKPRKLCLAMLAVQSRSSKTTPRINTFLTKLETLDRFQTLHRVSPKNAAVHLGEGVERGIFFYVKTVSTNGGTKD